MRVPSEPLLVTLYRISDGSYRKNKFSYAGKISCLLNYIGVFGRRGLVLFADKCRSGTLWKLRMLVPLVRKSSSGSSAQSWRLALQYALDHLHEEQIVYFLEDDYLHRPGAREAILEGLQLADYVTLYDHPDKYRGWAPSVNPLLEGNGERGEVVLTQSGHWKATNSTTMTFACRLKTLKEDRDIWLKHTEGTHPNDFAIFTELLTRPEKKRVLLVSIPAYSTHVEIDYPSPLINWKKIAASTTWLGLIKSLIKC